MAVLLALVASAAVPAAVLAAPSEAISAVITSPESGATFTRLDAIQFDVEVTHQNCAPSGYLWRFGDGSTSTLASATYRYSSLGTFTPNVKVTGACPKSSTSSITLTIVNLPPSATLEASGTQVAGEALAFTASGSDADGSVVSYAFTVDGEETVQASPVLTRAFTAAGSHDVSVQAIDNDGARSPGASVTIQVVAGPLATVEVAPPAVTLVAGGAQAFTATGSDAYGNAVALSPEWSADCGSVDGDGGFTAPVLAGPCTVVATQGEVSGAAVATVVADALASIVVTGPATLVAGTSGDYAAEGFDQHGNPVALATSSLSVTAPTSAGALDVCHGEGGVEGCLAVLVVPDALASIAVTGPATLVAGGAADYALAGRDQYGNAVALAQETLRYEAPTRAGPAVVSYSEAGVTGQLDVEVVHDALASIVVTGPAALPAGASATYALRGEDQHGNAVALAVDALDVQAPMETGPMTVSYTEAGVTGTMLVQVLPVTMDVGVATEKASYSVAEALAGVRGAVTVVFPGVGGFAGAGVEVVFTHVSPFGVLRTASLSGTTGPGGVFAFEAPEWYNLPGDYGLSATASFGGSQGAATGGYRVGP